MRILLSHNHYQQPGGEDRVFAFEADLLEARGHRVFRYTAHNDRIPEKGHLALASGTVWNPTAYRDLRDLIRAKKPDVAHFHNTFPLISPAAYHACRAEGVPVVQTLHNYRLICPNALLFRDGKVCEDCLGKRVAWPGVVHACYRGSRSASGAVATMLYTHRELGTWAGAVDRYVALTEFARRKFVEGGLPPEKLSVKPNFVHPDPGMGDGGGGYALYVGRLSPEKGLGTILAAWKRAGGGMPLKVVGRGPLEHLASGPAGRIPGVEWLGQRSSGEVYALMREASFLVFPSECYENLPTAIIESFACGTPVVASDRGAMGDLVEDGRTGLLFPAGDAVALAALVARVERNQEALYRMRREARREFEERYTAERSYRALIEIYRSAQQRSTIPQTPSPHAARDPVARTRHLKTHGS
jgi:glycosyltransferase involved in cell wall biosynthesis